MHIEARLQALGLVLPAPVRPPDGLAVPYRLGAGAEGSGLCGGASAAES